MIRLALRSLAGNRRRTLSSVLAVTIGVAFVVASLAFTDALRQEFGRAIEDFNTGSDLVVRREAVVDRPFYASEPFGEDVMESVVAVEGVARATPWVGADADLVLPGGGHYNAPGPEVGVSWADDGSSPLVLVEGSAPGPGEVSLDIDTAAETGLAPGDLVDIETRRGRAAYRISGVHSVGPDNVTFGASILAFDFTDAQRAFALPGLVQQIGVQIDPGADVTTVEAALAGALPTELETVPPEVLVADDRRDLAAVLDPLSAVLLAFALLAVLVATFAISNSFRVQLGQRGRAIGLLRSVGATQGQVLGSLVIELAFIGAAATVMGLVVGAAGADLLGSWLDVGRYGLEDPPVVVSVRTVAAALAVGLGVTVTALVLPARRLARAAPVKTLAGDQVTLPSSWHRRRNPAAVAVGGGLAVVIWQVWSPTTDAARNLVMLSIGGALVLAGLAVLVAGAATTLARWMARPMQTLLGAPGRLASANVAREPRRTSSALIALLVGVSVLASVGVVTRSIRSTVGGQLERGAIADYFISGSMDPTVTASIGELPEVASAVGLRENAARVGGSTTDVTGADLASLSSVLDLGVESGRVAPLEGPTVLLRDSEADRLDVRVGDRIRVQFDLGEADFTVGAVFGTRTVAGDFIIDVATYERLVSDDTDDLALISARSGVSDRAARAAISSITATYPSLEFWDDGEYRAAREGEIDVVLRVLDALLGLAVAATLFGVVNTLGLAVLQRRREIGLLRAVGMTRGQVKVMVLGESAVISVIGVVGGVGLGIGLGLVVAASLPVDLVAALVLPGRELAWILLGGLAVGLAGSVGPATRAARVDILEAIVPR